MTQRPNHPPMQLQNPAAARKAAAEIGLKVGRGSNPQQGSVPQMIDLIASGDALILLHAYDHPHEMTDAASAIRALAENQPQGIADTLRGLSAALENAAKRKD